MAEYYKGKKNWPKLILIYAVIGIVVYFLIYYFFLRGGVARTSAPYSPPRIPSY